VLHRAAGSFVRVTRTRRWSLAAVGVLAVALAGGICVWWLYPSRPGGTVQVSVYELNDEISGPTSSPPGWLGRLTGMCDGDSHYVRDGDRHYCLVLNGPLPVAPGAPTSGVEVTVGDQDGSVLIPAESVAILRKLASGLGPPSSAAGTHLVLSDGQPVAVLSASTLSVDGDLRIKPFVALCTRDSSDMVWPDDLPPDSAAGWDCA